MRTTSIEDPVVETPTPVVVVPNVISTEEEHILLDRAMTAAWAIESGMQQVLHLEDVADGLEDMAVIAGGIKEATPTETALLENVGDMATAGTNVSGDEIIPSMESYVGKSIAVEAVGNIREMAKSIWENIKRFLKSLWDKIDHFWQSLSQVFQLKLNNVEKLAARLKATGKEKVKDEPLHFEGLADILSVNYKPIANPMDLKKAANDYYQSVATLPQYWKSVESRGDFISSAISKFSFVESETAVNTLAHSLKGFPLFIQESSGVASAHKPEPGFRYAQGPSLFGNVVLVHKSADNNSDSAAAWLDRESRGGVSLMPLNQNAPPTNNNVIILPVLDRNTIADLLSSMRGYVTSLSMYNKTYAGQMRAKRDLIANMSQKAEASLNAAEGMKDNIGEAALANFRTLLRFNHAYSEWVRNPSIAIVRHAFTVINALALVITKSLDCYPALTNEEQATNQKKYDEVTKQRFAPASKEAPAAPEPQPQAA